MKRAENMDGSTETKLPSMKSGEFMDGRFILGTFPTIFLRLTSTSA